MMTSFSEKIKQNFRSTEGAANYIYAVVFMMVFLVIFSVVMLCTEMITNVNNVQKEGKVAINSFSVRNEETISDIIRQGTESLDSSLEELINDGAVESVKSIMINVLDLEAESYGLAKLTSTGENKKLSYYLTDFNIGYTTKVGNVKELNFYVSCTMNIPVYILGSANTTAKIPIHIESERRYKIFV